MRIFLLILCIIGLFCFVCYLFNNVRSIMNSKLHIKISPEGYVFIGWILLLIVILFELIFL